jgi:hypothetical protein
MMQSKASCAQRISHKPSTSSMGTALSVSAKPCFVLLRPHGIAALFVMKRLGIGVFWVHFKVPRCITLTCYGTLFCHSISDGMFLTDARGRDSLHPARGVGDVYCRHVDLKAEHDAW